MFDNTGSTYNVTKVLNSDYTLDVAAYEAYSPPYLSASYAILYMFFFAAYLACITHVLLYNWRDLALGFNSVKDSIKMGRGHWFRSSREQFTDVHNRLMMNCMLSPSFSCPWPSRCSTGVNSFAISRTLANVHNETVPILTLIEPCRQ